MLPSATVRLALVALAWLAACTEPAKPGITPDASVDGGAGSDSGETLGDGGGTDGTAGEEVDTAVKATCAANADLCDDKNPCTDDLCDAGAETGDGCSHAVKAGICDDKNACTVGDTCKGGQCTGGSAKVCAAPVGPCETVVCAPSSGCGKEPAPGACDDGDPCTASDTCSGGVCAGGVKDCDDGNPCTTDSCVKGQGCNSTATTGAPCGDGLTCQGTVCGLPCPTCPTCQKCDAKIGACKADPAQEAKNCGGGKQCKQGVCAGTVFLAPPAELTVEIQGCCGGCFGTMAWSSVTGAGSYEVRILLEQKLVWGPFSETSTKKAFDYLEPNLTHQFEVRACIGTGCSAWKTLAQGTKGKGCE